MNEMRDKERRGNATILFHTCASKQHHVFHIESLLCFHFHILVGIFHYRTWLVYSDDGLPQMPEVFMSKQVLMHTHLVFMLSFHTLIALSASVAWQSLLLALTSIDGHLHSPLISLIDVRLSSFFDFPLLISIIILFHPQCYIHGLRSCIEWELKKLKRVKKYEPIAWLKLGLFMINILC